jgi:hypothetical protein
VLAKDIFPEAFPETPQGALRDSEREVSYKSIMFYLALDKGICTTVNVWFYEAKIQFSVKGKLIGTSGTREKP